MLLPALTSKQTAKLFRIRLSHSLRNVSTAVLTVSVLMRQNTLKLPMTVTMLLIIGRTLQSLQAHITKQKQATIFIFTVRFLTTAVPAEVTVLTQSTLM